MKRSILAPVSVAAGLAVSCSLTLADPTIQASQGPLGSAVPTCSTESDCDAKWEAARRWVARNAGYRIRTATSDSIRTGNAAESRFELAALVTKESRGSGRYRFNIRLWCANIFGCSPNRLVAMSDFNRTLNAVSP